MKERLNKIDDFFKSKELEDIIDKYIQEQKETEIFHRKVVNLCLLKVKLTKI